MIFVTIPVLDKLESKFVSSLYQAISICKNHKIKVLYNEGDSLISRARNNSLSIFYNNYKEYDYFMSLDSDLQIINIYPENNIFDKLTSHNLDFVGGLYTLKRPNHRQCSSGTVDGKNPNYDEGIKEMKWLSSGCWCIKRSAITKMINAYPELIYDSDDGHQTYGLYMPMIHDKKYLSEDWSFAQRWRAIGGKIYADTSIVLNHIGKYPYNMWDVELIKGMKFQCR